MTLYIFSALKTLRDIVPPAGLTGLVHDESAYTVSATIPMDLTVVPGEHIGFMCVDGRFRMFTVTKAENKDFDATTIITGIDTAVQELKETIVPELQQLEVNLHDSVVALLDASDARSSWSVTGSGPAELKKHRAYYTSMWTMLETLAQLYEWRIIPHYYFASGAITGRTIELAADTATFRGRILQSKKDASNVYVIKSTPPITRLYGLGPSKSQEPGVSENLTFAEAEWSTAAGDPANKPKEQTYVDDPAAVAKYGVRSSTVQFDEVEDEKDLLQKTWNHLQTIKEPTCTVEATVQDLEQVPGYETKIIRLGDLVPVRLSNAAMEEARVIGIKRDYVKPWLTKVTIGDKTASLSTQVTNLMTNALHTHETLTIYKNRFHEDEALIQLNAQFVQANAERIELNAQLIGLYATYTDELTGRVTAAEIELDGMKATIDLWAGTLDEFGRRLDGAELMIDGLNHKITASVEDLDGKIAALELSLTDLEAKVVLKAEYDKDKNAMLTLISNNEESIATLAAQHGDRIAALELYTSDLESRVLLKAEYEEDKNAMLKLISNNEESIATLAAQHGDRLAALELYTSDLESRVLLKAEYEENREADLQLISNAQESVATLETKYDGQIASLTLRADEQGSQIAAKADLILLEGYVKMEDFEAVEGWSTNFAGQSISGSSIVGGSGDFDDLWCGQLNGGTAATQEWVEEQGFLKSADGTDGIIATQEWVQDQGYATQAWVNNKDYVLNSSLPSILISYATKNWVTEQGYLKTIPSTYATQSWVQSQGYLKSIPSNYATQAWVLSQDYSAKSWVEGKGYLTEVPSGYATEEWVRTNFSKASATYKPTAIERYGSVSGTSIPVRTLNESGTVLLTGTVDAGDIYQSGASTGYTMGYQQAITGAMIELDGSTVKVYSPDGGIDGPTLDISDELDAAHDDGYASGKAGVTLTSAGWVGGSNVVSASNGKSVTVNLPSFSTSGGTSFINNKTTVFFHTSSVSGYLASVEVDATSVYDDGYAAGYQAAKDAATVEAGVSWSNPAQNYAMVRYWASAKIDGEEVAYTSASESKNISGYV